MKQNAGKCLQAIAVAALLAAPLATRAAPADIWGTGASSATLECASWSADCGVATGPGNYGPYTDGYQQSSATSTVDDSRGLALSGAEFIDSNGLAMPHIRGFGSGANGVAQSSAWALNTYEYTGTATTKTLNIELTGSVTNPDNAGYTYLAADVYIFDSATLAGLGTTDLGALLGELLIPQDQVSLSIGGAQPATASLSLTLADGDQFSIWSRLSISASRGDQVEAMNSLDLSFTDNSGLVSATTVSPVPLPAAAWLFGSALLGLLGLARRRA